MKRLMTIVAALMIIVATNQAQTLEKLFDKYGSDERFEYVSIGKGMMNMASAFGGIGKNDKEMMSKLHNLKILSLNTEANSAIMKAFSADVDKVIANGNFESAMEVRDKGERVNIYFRVTGKDNADMLIITKEEKEFNIIWMNGKMTKEEMMNSFSANKISKDNQLSMR